MVGYHGHTETTPAKWRTPSRWRSTRRQLDIGHFIAANNYSPVEFIGTPRAHHARHVKDRKLHEGPNVPFGPAIRDRRGAALDPRHGWPMQATIEFEYPVPPGSDRMTEIAKSVKSAGFAEVGRPSAARRVSPLHCRPHV